MGNSMNVVAHNLQAMFSNRQLGIVNDRKEKSTEKLSSGYRINRAADDAAGLAISEKMRRQIRGLTQGTENAQDGISMCQIADGALAEVHEMLDRITELSVQSANGTNTTEDRQAIQQEVNAILSEIDRVCDTTKFNEQPIFQGAEGVTIIPATYTPTTVGAFTASGTPAGSQVGTYTIAAGSGGFSINGESHGWSDFSDGAGNTLADGTISAGTYSFTHNGVTMSLEVEESASMEDVVGNLNGAGYTTKISSSGETSHVGNIYGVFSRGYFAGHGKSENSTFRVEAEGDDLVLYTGLTDSDGNEQRFVCDLKENFGVSKMNDPLLELNTLAFKRTDIDRYYYISLSNWKGFQPVNGMEGLEGITALDIQNNMDGLSLNVHDYTENYQESTGSYSRTINKERHFMLNIEIQDKNVTLEIDKVFSPDYKGRQLTPEERISAEGDKEIWIQSGAEAGDGMYLTFGRMDTNILNINGMDVTTQSGADDAIEKSKDAINILNGIRSNIGAQQNRLEHTIRHQENTIENTQRAESLIRDTDMATEMMNFSAANIIQQAGQSMLTQANQSNQGVLSLLQ